VRETDKGKTVAKNADGEDKSSTSGNENITYWVESCNRKARDLGRPSLKKAISKGGDQLQGLGNLGNYFLAQESRHLRERDRISVHSFKFSEKGSKKTGHAGEFGANVSSRFLWKGRVVGAACTWGGRK